MVIKNFIDKLRNKGYDDLYLADLAHKWDVFLMFVFFGIQSIIPIGIGFLLEKVWEPLSILVLFWVVSDLFVFLLCFIPDAGIRESKEKGETDLRADYIIGSAISKFALKALRYAPIVSAILLIVSYITSLFMIGFSLISFVALILGGTLLLLTSRFYHKTLSKMAVEATYYAEWKTGQNVGHFDELVSRHDKWWIPSASLDFEKFNIDKFRSIRIASVLGTLASILTGFIYSLGVYPLIGVYMKLESPKPVVEQVVQNEDTQNVEQVSQPDTLVIEQVADEAMPVSEEDNDITGDPSVQNSNYSTGDIYLSAELDKMPIIKGAENYKTGLQNYLLSKIPQLKDKHVYVEFCINEQGKVYNIDTSLISNENIAHQVTNVLESMPPMQPGEINGQPVCFKTNISF
jgi:hypothetical protein